MEWFGLEGVYKGHLMQPSVSEEALLFLIDVALANVSHLSQAEEPSRMSMLVSSLCLPSRQPSSPLTQPTPPWCAWSRTAGEFPARGCRFSPCLPWGSPHAELNWENSEAKGGMY